MSELLYIVNRKTQVEMNKFQYLLITMALQKGMQLSSN